MSESDKEVKCWQRWMPGVLILAIAVVWFTTPFFASWLYDIAHKIVPQLANLGALGDTFGVANSLFSGLAFGLLIYSSWMQREALRLTQNELELTMKEVSGQRLALEAQSQHLERQGFERTLFEMLAVHRGLLTSMSCRSKHGIEAVGAVLHAVYQKQTPVGPVLMKGGESDQAYLDQYETKYAVIEHYVGHYFRSLYSIMQFIDGSEVVDKSHYARIIRAQLSKPELSLLFHNGLSSHATKMKPLIEKYGLLKHCSKDQIKGFVVLKPLYDDAAFGSSSEPQKAKD